MKKENDIIWYSENYLKNEVTNAYANGFSNGLRLEFHTVTPSLNDRTIEDIKNELRQFISSTMGQER